MDIDNLDLVAIENCVKREIKRESIERLEKICSTLVWLSCLKSSDPELHGMCNLLLLSLKWEVPEDVFLLWPSHTEDLDLVKAYPVPHPTLDSHSGYESQRRWDRDEYGDRRRDLCKWLSEFMCQCIKEKKKDEQQ